MLAIFCPGQGSQTPGFLAPWLELPGLRERLEGYADAAGVDLVGHGTTSDADTIRDTKIAQPLIVAAGLLGWEALLGREALFGEDRPSSDAVQAVGMLAGHSVGEITAAACAGVLDPRTAMTFVGLRGRGMADASAVRPTGMTAVVGGDAEEVLAAIETHGLTAANMNGAGQVVAAGTTDQLAALAADPPAKARVIPLSVAGAFHTVHMEPAVAELSTFSGGLTPRNARIPLLSNRDGQVVETGREVTDRLVSQVASPVRWDLCMQQMLDRGVSTVIELPPAGTLVGLAKRGMTGVASVALKTPDDLDKARAALAEAANGSEV